VRPAALPFFLLAAALPSAAAPLKPGTPALELRLEALGGQPTTLLGPRLGAGVGLAYRLTDQLAAVGDVQLRPGPGGGIASFAAGVQGTLDITPVVPYLEVAMAALTNRAALGYSSALRAGAGADYWFSRALAVGVVGRTYTAFDRRAGASGIDGFEASVRFTCTPGAR
jgi:hypothetical protein